MKPWCAGGAMDSGDGKAAGEGEEGEEGFEEGVEEGYEEGRRQKLQESIEGY